MSTVTDASPELEIRRALAHAHRIVSLAYLEPGLPLLRFTVTENGTAHAFCYESDQLAPWLGWLDHSSRHENITERSDYRQVMGDKDCVPFLIRYHAEYDTGTPA